MPGFSFYPLTMHRCQSLSSYSSSSFSSSTSFSLSLVQCPLPLFDSSSHSSLFFDSISRVRLFQFSASCVTTYDFCYSQTMFQRAFAVPPVPMSVLVTFLHGFHSERTEYAFNTPRVICDERKKMLIIDFVVGNISFF